jgi:hypothetical protein
LGKKLTIWTNIISHNICCIQTSFKNSNILFYLKVMYNMAAWVYLQKLKNFHSTCNLFSSVYLYQFQFALGLAVVCFWQ